MHLEDRSCEVLSAGCAADGERLARETGPDAVVLDVNLPDRSGLDLLEGLRRATEAPVLVITGSREMAPTILAMKGGAFDFIRKPIDLDVFDRALDRALEERRVSRALPAPSAAPPGEPGSPPEGIVGTGRRMQEILKEIGKVAASRAAVLLLGESGTGKDLVARIIHQYSSPARPFVPVNCAAIVETLLESELFGHERGAFTGAVASRPGKCELAADGTLFLDEIGDLSGNLQAKLLRLLQEREFERVGGVRRMPLHARLVAATNRDLPEAVRAGRYRDDLYQRLKVVTIELPPLRERREDIPALVEHLLARVNARYRRCVSKVPPEVMDELGARPWFGNVRELENALTRSVVMAPGDVLLRSLLPPPEAPRGGVVPVPPAAWVAPAAGWSSALAAPRPAEPPRAQTGEGASIATLDEMERDHIARALQFTGGHRGRTCELLGITRPTLERKLRKYGLSAPKRRPAVATGE